MKLLEKVSPNTPILLVVRLTRIFKYTGGNVIFQTPLYSFFRISTSGLFNNIRYVWNIEIEKEVNHFTNV